MAEPLAVTMWTLSVQMEHGVDRWYTLSTGYKTDAVLGLIEALLRAGQSTPTVYKLEISRNV